MKRRDFTFRELLARAETKELALFADRLDISEELVRLLSHLQQADTLLRAKDAVGRPMDFLVQELFREINTIGSKAGDAAITRHVVDFKAELERVREQVQDLRARGIAVERRPPYAQGVEELGAR